MGGCATPLPGGRAGAPVPAGLPLAADQPDADRVAREARHVVDVEPVHELRAVRLDRLHRDVQPLGDLARGAALRDALQDLALPPGEHGARAGMLEPADVA